MTNPKMDWLEKFFSKGLPSKLEKELSKKDFFIRYKKNYENFLTPNDEFEKIKYIVDRLPKKYFTNSNLNDFLESYEKIHLFYGDLFNCFNSNQSDSIYIRNTLDEHLRDFDSLKLFFEIMSISESIFSPIEEDLFDFLNEYESQVKFELYRVYLLT